jgi:DNA-binding beta-propeller fold protein YncE
MACLAPHPQSETCPDCAPFGPFERNNYFTGKFMTELDFKIETLFHSEKMRHHNQRLHGSGVVCGLKVVQDDNPACRDRFVVIQPGTAIDCCGHEIVLKDAEKVQLDQLPAIQDLIVKKDTALHRLQICWRFKECPTEQVPVLYDECGCDDTQCAPNRILESFEVGAVLDAALDLDHIQAPGLKWDFTGPPAHASQAVLHSATRRLYVITGDGQNTLYALDTDNFNVVGSHTFAARPVALAASTAGDRVYVAVLPASGVNTDPRQLAVLDTANLAGAPLRAQDIPDSGGNDLLLSTGIQAAGTGLVCLLLQKGDLQIWQAAVSAAGADLIPDKVAVAANVAGLAVASDGLTAYTLDPANNLVKVVDLAGKSLGADISALPAASQPDDLAVVASTGPDQLVVVSKATPGLLYLLGLSPVALLGSRQLDHPAKTVAVSPGGTWAYVLEEESGSYVQPVNLPNVQQDPAHSLGAAVKVGDLSAQVIVNDSGRRLFVPFTADLNNANQGGIAVVEVDETACADIFWKSLDGCPACDTEDCVVLATIENYKPGFQLLDPTDPPSEPVADKAASMARIDNHRGRKLLPSTAALAETIECLFSRRAGQGKQGPPGQPGQSIQDVKINYIPCDQAPQKPSIQTINGLLTLVMDIPDGCLDLQVNHVDCSKTPDARIQTIAGVRTLVLDLPPALKGVKVQVNKVGCDQPGGGRFDVDPAGACTLFLEIPVNCDPVVPPALDLPHICAINWPHDQVIIRGTPDGDETLRNISENGLLIAFDQRVLAETLTENTFQVLYRPDSRTVKPARNNPFRINCYCNVIGAVSGVKTDRQCEAAIKEPGNGDTPAGPVTLGRFLPMGTDTPIKEWPNGEYQVSLEGDQVLGDKQITVPGRGLVNPGVDADHMGPGLENPPWLPPRPVTRVPTGDSIEGGTFVSSFKILDR